MTQVKVFQYLEKYDAFDVTPEYRDAAKWLGLGEWTPVVWICRLLALDNDYGEHIFDNWDEREALEQQHGEDDLSTLLVVVPGRFKDGRDGPCHSDALRKRFWTDVLKGMHLSLETLFVAARENNEAWKNSILADDKYMHDLEDRIVFLQDKFGIKDDS